MEFLKIPPLTYPLENEKKTSVEEIVSTEPIGSFEERRRIEAFVVALGH